MKEVKRMAYTDEEIRNMKKITCKIAGDYLGIASTAVSIGMRKRQEEERRKEERRKRYNAEVTRTLALTNLAEDYNIACKIRYISVVEASGTSDEQMAEWIKWAKAKADWYDPTVAKDDEYFGKREHEKDAEKKKLQYRGYWW